MTTLEYRITSAGDRYRPEYRRSASERWWFMRGGPENKPLDFPTATAAKAAADQAVALENAKANPSYIHEEEPEADVLGVEDWARERADRSVKEQLATFGTIFVRHRAVVVEKRRARR